MMLRIALNILLLFLSCCAPLILAKDCKDLCAPRLVDVLSAEVCQCAK